MLASNNYKVRLKRFLGRRLAAAAGILAAAAALALPAAAQSTNAVFVSLGGTGEAGYQDGLQGFSEFNTPSAVAAPGNGFLYIADFGNNAVRKLDLANRRVSTHVVANVSHPVGVVFDSNGNLFVANQGTGSITKYDASGNFVTSFRSIATAGAITALAIDEIDYLYVAHANGKVNRISPSGVGGDLYEAAAGSEFRGVAVATDGSVYASDAARHVIWRFASFGSAPQVFAGMLNAAGKAVGPSGFGQLDRPHNIAFSTNGTLVVADRGNHQLRAVNCDGIISTLVGIDPALWFTFESPEVFPGWWDSSPQFAELREPIGVTVDAAGRVFDTEAYYHLVRGGVNITYPSCGDVPPTDPQAIAVQISPDQGFYQTSVEITVSPAVGSTFGSGVQIYYTTDGSTPTKGSTRAPIVDGLAKFALQGPIDLSSLRVRAYNNDVAGPVAQGREIELPRPGLNPPVGFFVTNVVITVTNANSPSGLFPGGTRIFYTTDGSQPTQSSSEAEISNGIARISLSGPINLQDLQVRAFVGNTGSVTVRGEPTSNIPNIISFGFEPPQEASSDFIASPGQRFYAPVTLTISPGQKMYGLQFGLNVTNLSGPAPANYNAGFESMLMKPVQPSGFTVIPPATYKSRTVTITPVIVSNNVVWITNVVLHFDPLLSTNSNNNLLMVGWLERYQATNLYNTLEHDLIRYSLPHDRLFVSQEGNQVVAGGYSFVVPGTARDGDTYQVEISRPSANADGIREDVVIETPVDPNGTLRARQTITVGERRYTVGDLAPFRWFNAGDFGDGSIVNNDMEQIHQTVIYGVNAPPPGSDMEGAIDSCCVDTNGVNLAGSFQPWDGNDTTINRIGFGDGELDIADLYVSFRRALDPSLVWFERYWENGTLRANVIPNTFRGQISGFSASSFRNTATVEESRLGASSTTAPSSVHFSVGAVIGSPGQTVEVPIYASIKGPHPIKTLLLNLSVKTIDGRAALTENVSFWAHPLLGGPTFGGSGTTKGYGAAWIDPNHSGLFGDVQIGTLFVPIPANATASSAFLVSIEKVSASPNGVGKFPVTTSNAAIIMANRANVGWNDGIPDAWRVQYFGTLGTLSAASDFDADGDGVSNRAEFDLGSNPTNPGDHLRVNGNILPDKTMTLRFPTAAGYTYQLMVSTNLANWTVVQENILGTGSVIELTSPSEAPLGYYRIQVQK